MTVERSTYIVRAMRKIAALALCLTAAHCTLIKSVLCPEKESPAEAAVAPLVYERLHAPAFASDPFLSIVTGQALEVVACVLARIESTIDRAAARSLVASQGQSQAIKAYLQARRVSPVLARTKWR